jgi:hypothetical protein
LQFGQARSLRKQLAGRLYFNTGGGPLIMWSPAYNAVQEEGLLDNILTIVARDFKEALDVLYPIEAVLPVTDPRHLLDFQERSLGQIQRLVFPSLAIGPNRNASTEDADQAMLREAIRFDSWIGVTDDSDETVTRRVTRYAGTYDMVLRTAAKKNKSDFFRNMSAKVFGLVLELEHTYGPIGTENSVHFRSVKIEGTILINES